MSLSLRKLNLLSAAAVLAVSGAAHAATISFASDDDSGAFTLIGTAGSAGAFHITNGRDPVSTPVTLRIDDDNMVAPTASLAVGLRVDLTATHMVSQPISGGQVHVYGVSGQYTFVNPVTSEELFRVTIAPGASRMITLGSDVAWGSAGSIFGSDADMGTLAGVNWIPTAALTSYAASLGVSLVPYGLDAFAFEQEDYAFTLTSLNGGAGVAIDPTSKVPMANWGSEASHSSHAPTIPAPGAMVAFGLASAGLAWRRRRGGA